MSDGSAWEREALSIKQVPSLQALLRCCDERLLVRAIVEEHAVLAGDWDALPAKRKRAAEKRLAATLATMRGLPLDKKGARGSLLLPHESFVLHARSGLIERHVSAALLSLDDVPLARRAVQRSDAATPPGEAEGPQPRPYHARSVGADACEPRVAGRFPVLPRALPRVGVGVLGDDVLRVRVRARLRAPCRGEGAPSGGEGRARRASLGASAHRVRRAAPAGGGVRARGARPLRARLPAIA